jgi:hypothetical protein
VLDDRHESFVLEQPDAVADAVRDEAGQDVPGDLVVEQLAEMEVDL